jgi:HK97 family phage portal protein
MANNTNLFERVGDFLKWGPGGLAGAERKEALGLSSLSTEIIDAWRDATWAGVSFENFVELAYRQNSAVFATIQTWATAFIEPPLCVYDTKTKEKVEPGTGNHVADHLYSLIKNPNPEMGEKELWLYMATYTPLGGNGYLAKYRSQAKIVTQLWPYHHGKLKPVPMVGEKPERWISHYRYSLGGGQHRTIPVEDVIHLKWMPDPNKQWQGISALEPVWREVLSDNELTRFVKAMLENDAVPRTALKLPGGILLNPKQLAEMRRDWRLMLGGKNRGDVAILQAGMEIERLALNMQELATDALRRIDESRIAACLGMHPAVVPLYVGLEKNTYNNNEEAQRDFTNRRLVPRWEMLGSELSKALVPEMDPRERIYLAFDLTKVKALAENVNEKAKWVIPAYKSSLPTLNEALTALGFATLKGPEGDERYKAPAPVLPAPAPGKGKEKGDNEGDQDNGKEAGGDADGSKASGRKALPLLAAGRSLIEYKAGKKKATRESIERRIEKAVARYIEDEIEALADLVEEAA